MRRAGNRRMWLGVILMGAMCLTAAANWPPLAIAADMADATATVKASGAEAVSQNLRKVLDGAAPMGVTDLRAMQGHVRKLSEQLKKCTVGVQVQAAWGSGVIISKDGYVLTAAHVAGQPNRDCTFTLADGREVKGKTLGLFRTQDAGLMKITDPGDYPHAELGNSSQLKEGQWCIAMGHPGGYQSDRGAVLRLGRVLSLANDAITTNCTLVGGDSGGPLFDMDGKVIGINSRIQELLISNLHVPVNAFHERDAWNRLVKGDVWGHMLGQDPWLGVEGDSEVKEARIGKVKSDSPAEKYGLKVGDVVIAFDGREIAEFESLKQAVADCHPNESVKLRLKRGSELLEIRVRLGKRPD
jgi:serine protease Do